MISKHFYSGIILWSVLIGVTSPACQKHTEVKSPTPFASIPTPIQNDMLEFVPKDADAIFFTTGNLILDTPEMQKQLALLMPRIQPLMNKDLIPLTQNPADIFKSLGVSTDTPMHAAAFLKNDVFAIHLKIHNPETFQNGVNSLYSNIKNYINDDYALSRKFILNRIPPQQDNDTHSTWNVMEVGIMDFSTLTSVTLAIYHTDTHAVFILTPDELLTKHQNTQPDGAQNDAYRDVLSLLENYTKIPQNHLKASDYAPIAQNVMISGSMKTEPIVFDFMPQKLLAKIKTIFVPPKGGIRLGGINDPKPAEDDCHAMLRLMTSKAPEITFTQSIVDGEHFNIEWRTHIEDSNTYKTITDMHKASRPLDKDAVSATAIAVDFKRLVNAIKSLPDKYPEEARSCTKLVKFIEAPQSIAHEDFTNHDEFMEAIGRFDGMQYTLRSSKNTDISFEMTFPTYNDTDTAHFGPKNKTINEYTFELYGKDISKSMDVIEKVFLASTEELPFLKDFVNTVFSQESGIRPFKLHIPFMGTVEMKINRTQNALKFGNDEAWLKNEYKPSPKTSSVFYETVDQIEHYLNLSRNDQRAQGYVHQQLATDNGDLVWTRAYFLPENGWESQLNAQSDTKQTLVLAAMTELHEDVINGLETRLKKNHIDVEEREDFSALENTPDLKLSREEQYQCIIERFDSIRKQVNDIEEELRTYNLRNHYSESVQNTNDEENNSEDNDYPDYSKDNNYTDYYKYAYSKYDWKIINDIQNNPQRLTNDNIRTRVANMDNRLNNIQTAVDAKTQKEKGSWHSEDENDEDDSTLDHKTKCLLFLHPNTIAKHTAVIHKRMMYEYKTLYAKEYVDRPDVHDILLKTDRASRECGYGRLSKIALNVSEKGDVQFIRSTSLYGEKQTHLCIQKHFASLRLPAYNEPGVHDIQMVYPFEITDDDKKNMPKIILGSFLTPYEETDDINPKIMPMAEAIHEEHSHAYMEREDVKNALNALNQEFEKCGAVCASNVGLLVTKYGHFKLNDEYKRDLIDKETYQCMKNTSNHITFPSFETDSVYKLTHSFVPSKDAKDLCEEKQKRARPTPSVVRNHLDNINNAAKSCGNDYRLHITGSLMPEGKIVLFNDNDNDSNKNDATKTCIHQIIENYRFDEFDGDPIKIKFTIKLP